MENKMFRKTALDRISSPEQLNEYMKVVGHGVWFILAGLAAVFIAFAVWGFTGSIPETAEVSGTILSPEGNPMAVYCYLPIDEAKPLAAGMSVRVSPGYAPREQYGYIYGTISSVSSTPVTMQSLTEQLGTDTQYLSLQSGNLIEVIAELGMHEDGTPKWSTSRGASVNLTVGSTCSVTVITYERKPYELMFR